MEDTKKLPDDPAELADLIDQLMIQGSGHVNITSDNGFSGLNVSVVNSTEFCGKGACCQPTEAVDDDD